MSIKQMPLSEKLSLIHEIMLVISHHDRITTATGPKVDLFYLIRAILDGEQVSCTTKQNLFAVLRKSPVWNGIRPFLKYQDTSCARKGCQCGSYTHEEGTGKCSGYHYKGPYNARVKVNCECKQFIPKDFK